MQRFYHREFFLNYLKRHKILVASFLIFLGLAIYLLPIFPYIPLTARVVWDFATSKDDLKQDMGRTNVLLLGLDGRRGEASGNTDTIIFASIDRAKRQNLMLSIPRDLWIDQTKINDAYPSGNRENGRGLEKASTTVSAVVGQPVHYSMAVSFDVFVRIIDTLGGVDVVVDRSFVDDSYPIAGRENDLCGGDPKTLCRWEILTFNKGLNHFDGQTALKFARSRHSRGEEGTDIARAVRQQKIIVAVKQKLFSPAVILNPQKIRELLEIVNSSIDTNINSKEFASFAKLALSSRSTPLKSAVIPWDESLSVGGALKPDSGMLYHPANTSQYKNQWVLLPIGNSYLPIHNWVQCLLDGRDCVPEDYISTKDE